MKKLLFYMCIMLMLAGCAQLDKAGDYVLKEVSSINDNPEGHEETRTLSEDWGKKVEGNKETSKE